MTNISICTTCQWFVREDRSERRNRCMRPLRFRDGSSFANVPAAAETDDYADPSRVENDKCGPTFKNWRIKDDISDHT
jgi:hypothetical protein